MPSMYGPVDSMEEMWPMSRSYGVSTCPITKHGFYLHSKAGVHESMYRNYHTW